MVCFVFFFVCFVFFVVCGKIASADRRPKRRPLLGSILLVVVVVVVVVVVGRKFDADPWAVGVLFFVVVVVVVVRRHASPPERCGFASARNEQVRFFFDFDWLVSRLFFLFLLFFFLFWFLHRPRTCHGKSGETKQNKEIGKNQKKNYE